MITLVATTVFSVFGFSEMRNWQSLRLRQEDRLKGKLKEKVENTVEKLAEQVELAEVQDDENKDNN
tara:strand:+ start:239 stop:436 length:198 start_codon:yes stop_codon:yes gene_type:complete